MKVRLVSLNIGSIVLLILVGVLIFRYSYNPETADGQPPHCPLCAQGTPCANAKLDDFLVRNKWMEQAGPDAGPVLLETGDTRTLINPLRKRKAPSSSRMDEPAGTSN
jgi:hypothetical protein